MLAKPRVYLDTSALFAGIWSATGGARMILKLGEAEAIQLVISPQVLAEIENAIRSKAPEILGALALILDRSRLEVSTTEGNLESVQDFLQHPGDARIFSAALGGNIDYFVTLDRKHFLDNDQLRESTNLPIGTPGDFLDWFRSSLQYLPSSS